MRSLCVVITVVTLLAFLVLMSNSYYSMVWNFGNVMGLTVWSFW
jgi:hypothetical protein